MEEYITDQALLSCYDLHYKKINGPFDFAELIYLDSGGYEASKDTELSETFDKLHVAQKWDAKMHQRVLTKWKSASPTVFVNFDHPKDRTEVATQIARAKKLKIPNGPHGRALLLKHEGEKGRRLDMDAILKNVKAMDGFSVIGVIEKEVGNSLLGRMVNIARLRKELDAHFVDLPIHVFGCLDTIATYLYFLAGADIFDGLTWLRYAFWKGSTIYRHSYGALELPIDMNSDIVEASCWPHNYQYMQEMKLVMCKFTQDGNFAHFAPHDALIKHAFDSMNAELAGD